MQRPGPRIYLRRNHLRNEKARIWQRQVRQWAKLKRRSA